MPKSKMMNMDGITHKGQHMLCQLAQTQETLGYLNTKPEHKKQCIEQIKTCPASEIASTFILCSTLNV